MSNRNHAQTPFDFGGSNGDEVNFVEVGTVEQGLQMWVEVRAKLRLDVPFSMVLYLMAFPHLWRYVRLLNQDDSQERFDIELFDPSSFHAFMALDEKARIE